MDALDKVDRLFDRLEKLLTNPTVAQILAAVAAAYIQREIARQ